MFRLLVISALVALGSVRASPLEHKIVGGQDTPIEQYPHQLSLELNGRHTCGASLIKPNVAVTAAHCIDNRPPSSFSVRAGTTYREYGGQEANVKGICVHPEYSKQVAYDYDVAVLVLDRPLTLTESVQTIELYERNAEVPTGTVAEVSGWGAVKQNNNQLPVILQSVTVPKISHQDCANAYYHYQEISNRMICFGLPQGGKDSCQGDSGGPLVVDGKLAGVVSWGIGCAQPGLPGVYTKVSNSNIQDFIEQCPTYFH